MDQSVIIFFIIMTLAGALTAAIVRRLLYAVFWLGLAFAGLAGLFLALGSPFVGAMQFLIYVGGIMILMVFGVMLSVSMGAVRPPRRPGKVIFALAGALLIFCALHNLLVGSDFGLPAQATSASWDLARLGDTLLTRYNLVFEALSLLLVVAIMGAILIAHKGRKQL